MLRYFKRIKDILTYYDYEPLIFFVALFDIIWVGSSIFSTDEWNCNSFQTFDVTDFLSWMVMIYWFGSILIILCINNPKWLTRLIILHTIQSIVYAIDNTWFLFTFLTDFIENGFSYISFHLDLLRQLFWMYVWVWILFQMKKKELYQRLGL
jgi:hypothetical protein